MPQVVPLVAAVAAPSIGSAIAVGLNFAASGIAASAFGAVVSFGINQVAGAALGGGKKSGVSAAGGSSSTDSGLKTVVRLSDDTQKLIYGRARIGGTLAYIETYPTAPDSDGISQTGDNLFLHMVVMHCGHEVDAFEEIYLNEDLVTLDASGFVQEDRYKKDGKSFVRIIHHTGSDTQSADSLLVAESANWTTDHRLRGIAYTYMRLQWNPDVFTGGIPMLNVVIRGKKVYDPRTTLTAWSDNAALCVRDYLTSRDSIDQPYGFGASSAEVDDSFTTEAANICEESITKLDATTIDRYTCNGIVDTGSAPLDNLEDLLTSLVGTVTVPRGTFRIYAGAYNTPESTVVDESWLSGSLKSRNRIARQDLYNAVRGLYVEPIKSWQSTDFPAVTSSTYETQDGERIYTDIKLPYTIDPEAAQRIAKIILRKGREQISVTMPCNYKALQFAVWDNIKLNNTARGWGEKVFRIVNLTFDINQGVMLQLREENALSYDWSASDAEAIAFAPDTNLPSPFVVAVPSSVSYDSRSVLTVGGDTVYNLVLQWAPYGNAFVTNGGQFEIQFKLSTDSEWRPSFFVNGDSISADIPSTTPNVNYDLRVRAVNILGARSGWVTIEDAMIGSSGGVLSSLDWGSVAASATAFNDWDSVASTPTAFNDYGAVV